MKGKGPFQIGTVLKFKRPVSIVVVKDDSLEEHLIDAGISCVIHSLDPPKVDIVGDEKVLRVELDPWKTPWADFFEVISYRHLRVIK